MEKIEAYKSSDGMVFLTKEAAQAHETELNYIAWYLKDPFYCLLCDSTLEWNDVKDWLEARDLLRHITPTQHNKEEYNGAN